MMGKSNGRCYLCGVELGKTAMKNHLLKAHLAKDDGDDQQRCYLLKIEGAYAKQYWLYVDIPADKPLSALDTFLREIWLECCGHLSAFRAAELNEIGKNRKWRDFTVGDQVIHEYDFGTTTECLIKIVNETKRVKQKKAVRLLARNVPPQFTCAACGEPADHICCECIYDTDNPFFCKACTKRHDHDDMFLPITNSPRMGECGYNGELDVFEFDPDSIKSSKE